MGYVAVRGGLEAIEASLERIRFERVRKGRVLDPEAIAAGMRSLVDQVMSESSLYSEDLAALAIKQAEGSPEEAVFLLRAYRSTLPRKHYARSADPRHLFVERRISSTFKDVPGGQILGTSLDYSHRLMDFDLLTETEESALNWLEQYLEKSGQAIGTADGVDLGQLPRTIDYLRGQGLMKDYPVQNNEPGDITKKSLAFPAGRSERLQVLTRGQTGAVTALGYAALRGYGATLHPAVSELRVGRLSLAVPDPFDRLADDPEEDYYLGEIRITEVEALVPVVTDRPSGQKELSFDLGYGFAFGQNETKAIAMSLLDQCLERPENGHAVHDEEFVLLHVDSVEATGFISHLKLPHYVTFQSELDSVRKTRLNREENS
jgi:alpha-D-ribose 1-methylphosphonate 5-triphosphate synthase subunit PhnI